jgi:peptide deformylase
MAVLDILLYPHPTLRIECEKVETIDDEIIQILDDMAETMYTARGVGLAAPQVGIEKHITVIDPADVEERGSELIELINPVVVDTWGEKLEYEEGCLSFPDLYDKVKRPAGVRVEALNRKGESFTIEGEGLLSVVLQHEIDHLNGVLFIDYLSPMRQNAIKRKMKKRFGKGTLKITPGEA